MKLSLLVLGLVACSQTLPPNRSITERKDVLPPSVSVQIISFEPLDEQPPVRTWLTGAEVQEAIEARKDCRCVRGDPLCECLR